MVFLRILVPPFWHESWLLSSLPSHITCLPMRNTQNSKYWTKPKQPIETVVPVNHMAAKEQNPTVWESTFHDTDGMEKSLWTFKSCFTAVLNLNHIPRTSWHQLNCQTLLITATEGFLSKQLCLNANCLEKIKLFQVISNISPNITGTLLRWPSGVCRSNGIQVHVIYGRGNLWTSSTAQSNQTIRNPSQSTAGP